ncbi:portal protein [Caedibacter taeniospiralis]|uniref:portal protein n=1 Tax=Caedibacter taeniospiralis TaxID=28907 RepID=UPI000C27CA39|nr:hypothetical protein [Caedibacter taeniospiralis]
MEQKLTVKQKEALDLAQYYFRYAATSQVNKAYRKKAIEDYGFYDGTGQWDKSQLHKLSANGYPPEVLNIVKPIINSLTGVDVQTRFRVAFRSSSGNVKDDRLAKAITHLGYHIQENQDMTHKATQKFMDMLITGIGWSNLFKQPSTSEIIYEHVHPLDVLFDPDDLSSQLNNSEFVIRIRWISLAEMKRLWPKHSSYFDSRFSVVKNVREAKEWKQYQGEVSPEIQQRAEIELDTFYLGEGYGRRVRVIEVQYRQEMMSFEGMDINGHYFATFNEKEALSLVEKMTDLERKSSKAIMRVLFTEDRLLEYAPLKPNVPDLPDFTYIPCLWSRRYSDGVPDGWLSSMKPVQRRYNSLQTRLSYLLSSTRAIYDEGAFSNKEPHEIEAMLSDPGAAIEISPGSRFELHANNQISGGYFTLLEKTVEDIQRVSGYYDEALGKETNAQSGVAIRARQVNSVRGQTIAFDNLKLMKKREARMMLNLIQSGSGAFLESQILTEDEKREIVILNCVHDVDGKRVVVNDIRTLPLSIHIEEVPDFESPTQEQQARLDRVPRAS